MLKKIKFNIQMDNILIIAAHPDDDILGCGGFLAKYGESIKIRIIFIAEGSSCRFDGDEIDCNDVNIEILERNKYCLNALSVFGITDVKFYNLPCGRLDTIPIIDINKIIENEISECNPEIIFTHFEYDNNNDHRVVYRSTMMAARPGIFDSIKSVISYEVPSSTEWSFSNAFQPNLFEVLSQECIDKKWRALLEYKSEVLPYPHPRSYEGLVTLARFRGMQTGVEFAEAYHLIRSMK